MSQIIVGIDGSARAEDALIFAKRLADITGATLTLAAAFPYEDWPSSTASNELRDHLSEEAGQMLERMRDLLDGETVTTHAIADPSPARALHRLAERDGAALIVVGSTHRGRVGRVLPGSTADRLMHGAPCPVAIVPIDYREREQQLIRTIGVGYDGTEESRAAVNAAAEIVHGLGAHLRVMRVFEALRIGSPALMSGPGYVSAHSELERAAEQDLERLVAGLPEAVSAEAAFLAGGPARELAAQSEGLDLLLLGARGYGPLRAVLLGGVSRVVVREAACPVIVLPRGARRGLRELFAPAPKVCT